MEPKKSSFESPKRYYRMSK